MASAHLGHHGRGIDDGNSDQPTNKKACITRDGNGVALPALQGDEEDDHPNVWIAPSVASSRPTFIMSHTRASGEEKTERKKKKQKKKGSDGKLAEQQRLWSLYGSPITMWWQTGPRSTAEVGKIHTMLVEALDASSVPSGDTVKMATTLLGLWQRGRLREWTCGCDNRWRTPEGKLMRSQWELKLMAKYKIQEHNHPHGLFPVHDRFPPIKGEDGIWRSSPVDVEWRVAEGARRRCSHHPEFQPTPMPSVPRAVILSYTDRREWRALLAWGSTQEQLELQIVDADGQSPSAAAASDDGAVVSAGGSGGLTGDLPIE